MIRLARTFLVACHHLRTRVAIRNAQLKKLSSSQALLSAVRWLNAK